MHGVGDVVLALVVVGPQLAQHGKQSRGVGDVHAGIDLTHAPLLGRSVTVLDDALDVAAGAAKDAPVARRIVDLRGHQRQRGAVVFVMLDELAQGRRTKRGQVAVEDQQCAAARPDGARSLKHGMPRAALFLLQDERSAAARKCLADAVGLVTDDRDRAGRLQGVGDVKDPGDHRPPRDGVQELDCPGAHSRSLAGGQHEDAEASGGQRSGPRRGRFDDVDEARFFADALEIGVVDRLETQRRIQRNGLP